MVLAWQELDVVLDKIAPVDEVLTDDLLKDIFFRCHLFSLAQDLSGTPRGKLNPKPKRTFDRSDV
jgi:hypothetical protein